ncbi:MAG: hydrogenase maturation nickel metallochaperone HypA [Candidatus Woesearchaeota archaeon]|jgi:Zn finger protein HypA/HybF involved in hydrogenase expression
MSHEHLICKEIIQKANSLGKVKKILVDCGALAHLPADELKHALEHQCKFDIEVNETPAKVICEDCGYTGIPKILEHSHDLTLYECPKCGSVPEIVEGDQIFLKSVDVD